MRLPDDKLRLFDIKMHIVKIRLLACMNDRLSQCLRIPSLIVDTRILRRKISDEKFTADNLCQHSVEDIVIVLIKVEEIRCITAPDDGTLYSRSNDVDIGAFLLVHRHRNKDIPDVHLALYGLRHRFAKVDRLNDYPQLVFGSIVADKLLQLFQILLMHLLAVKSVRLNISKAKICKHVFDKANRRNAVNVIPNVLLRLCRNLVVNHSPVHTHTPSSLSMLSTLSTAACFSAPIRSKSARTASRSTGFSSSNVST